MNLHSLSQGWSLRDFIGTWRAANGAGLEIKDSSQIFILFNEDRKRVEKVNFDFSKNPGRLNFEVKDSGAVIHLNTLFQFVTKDLIQWQIFEGESPANFTASHGELVYLRRKF
jgi:hypothetical protein